MDLSSLTGISSSYKMPSVTFDDTDFDFAVEEQNGSAFDSLFQSAVKMINETNDYSNAAEEEEIKYALGETDSIHDLQIAQQKANVSLQYTVAVRDAFVNAYKEIMNIQF